MRYIRNILPVLVGASLVVGVTVMLLTSCGGGPSVVQVPTPVPVVRHAHRPATFVTACIEFSSNYDKSYSQQAEAWIASGLDAAVRDNSDGFTFALNYIDEAPRDPSGDAMTVSVPAIPAYPADPTLLPYPTPGPDSYAAGAQRSKIDAANTKAVNAFNQGVAQVDAQVAAAKKAVDKQAQTLRTAQPPAQFVGQHVSVWGCVGLAAQRFSQFPNDTHVLILATTADERTFKDTVPLDQLAGLRGSKTIGIYYECTAAASWCTWSQGTWTSVFQSTGVASVQWLDATGTQSTSPLVPFDAGVSTGQSG